MVERTVKRAALWAGVCLAVLGNASPGRATTVTWGATRAPADIIAPEPARKSKKAKPAESKIDKPKADKAKADKSKSDKPKTAKPELVKVKKPTTEKTSDKPEKAIRHGPLHVIVSVDTQRASLYANGRFIASSKVSTGTKTHPTPMGVFSVIQKNRHHVSNLYGAPMPYMQRLTWSGTAMHAGPLPGYPASHGCIRMTGEFAQLLWKATRIGARVIVTREDVKPVEFAHTRLNFPRPPVADLPFAVDDPVESAGALVRTADATSTFSSAAPQASARPPGTFEAISRDMVIQPPARTPSTIERKASPVSIFISRKDGRLYVRQAMQPLFDLPLTLRDPEQPVGTHVYTVMEMKDGAARWTAVSIPSSHPREVMEIEVAAKNSKKTRRAETTGKAAAGRTPTPDAGAALDRIDLSQQALGRIAGLITPGSSLIVSDNGLSSETGKYTDFIVLTR